MRRLAGALLLAGAAANTANAQSPVPASCTPGAATNANARFALLGITNVTLGSINNTTAGYADGYQDYSATQQAALVVGRSYTLSVTAGSTALAGASGGENTGAWIDYNNDGSFNGANELVMPVAPAPAGGANPYRIHTVSFTVPGTAVTGVPLRLRINSDFVSVPLPTACSTPQYSQCEDYAVTLGTNSSPPTAAFTASTALTCDGCVQFADASQNVPTSWSWNFGDGVAPGPLNSTQNPRYCYPTPGTYNVTLTVTNAVGTSTSTATTITYNNAVPVAAACRPVASSPLGAYGPVRFRLGTAGATGSVDNASTGAAGGYQDFTCTQRATLLVGRPYPLTIDLASPATANQDTRVYLDLNNDGIFTATEIVFQALATGTPAGNLTLPAATNLNQPLRLRVVSDGGGTNPTACALQSGQAEDYTITALPDTAPPMVSFTSDYVAGACVNPIQFTSQATGNPTAYLWNFGDGLTSTAPNPSHQYAASGTYTVSLTATNANGSTPTSQPNFVIQVPCLTYCAANGSGGGGGPGGPQVSPFFLDLLGVTAAATAPGGPVYVPFTYRGTPANAAGGYGNYTAQTINLRVSQTHTLTAIANTGFTHRTVAWIDYNRDGVFDNSPGGDERVFSVQSTNGQASQAIPFTVPLTVPGAPAGFVMTGQTRMRVVVAVTNNPPNPCAQNIQNAEVEDYTVNILPEILGTRAADALPALGIYPNPTPDGRLALTLTDAAAAGSYAVAVQNLLGATLLQTRLRLAPGTPAALDLSALPPGVYVLRLTDAAGRAAVRRVVRE